MLNFKQIISVYLALITPFASNLAAGDFIHLEDMAQDFVLELKKIELPQYPSAFNPCIIRWNGRILMSFRVIPDPKNVFYTRIGLVWLDKYFKPVGKPQFLITRDPNSSVPSRAEDARLIEVGGRLYMAYSDNPDPMLSRGGFRMYIAELHHDGSQFSLGPPECLSHFDGENQELREKNWVPFDYHGHLLLAYSINPHRILRPLLIETGTCETVAMTLGSIEWDWGELRGGTPGLLHKGEYLAFFHSAKKMASAESDGKLIWHYFMGAYTFDRHPPFAIKSFSPLPIISKGFYTGKMYKHYWHPLRVVFPCGYIFDNTNIWLAYGRQDHEIWIAKIDKKKLLDSLIPINTVESSIYDDISSDLFDE